LAHTQPLANSKKEMRKQEKEKNVRKKEPIEKENSNSLVATSQRIVK